MRMQSGRPDCIRRGDGRGRGVTSSGMRPGSSSGDTHATAVLLRKVAGSSAWLPKRHESDEDGTKPVPDTVIRVPPALGQELGRSRATFHAALYENAAAVAEKSAPLLAARTSTCAGAPWVQGVQGLGATV